MQSIPTLILLGLLLYIDRILRRESIFDSSALTCTIFVAHVLNVCRSSIAHVDRPLSSAALKHISPDALPLGSSRQHMIMGMLGEPSSPAGAAAAEGGSIGSNASTLFRNTTGGATLSVDALWLLRQSERKLSPSTVGKRVGGTVIPLAWWQEDLVYVLYAVASVLLMLDVDVVSWILPPSAHCNSTHLLRDSGSNNSVAWTMAQLRKRLPHPGRGGTGNGNIVRISTVVTHCILVGLVLQMQVEASVFMTSAKVMVRSLAFMMLSIVWTYAVGIQDAYVATRYFPYYVNPYFAQLPSSDEWDEERSSMHAGTSSGKGLTEGSCRRKQRGGSQQQQHQHLSHQSQRFHHHQALDDSGGEAMMLQQHRTGPMATPDSAVYSSYIQPFTPCQLRFAVILFSDSWHMPVAAIAMGVIMGDRLQKAVCQPFPHWSSSTVSASVPSEDRAADSGSVPSQSNQGMGVVRRAMSLNNQHHHHHNNNNNLGTDPRASSSSSPSSSSTIAATEALELLGMREKTGMQQAVTIAAPSQPLGDMDETIALFRKAQMQAAATVAAPSSSSSSLLTGPSSMQYSDVPAASHLQFQVSGSSSAWRHPPHERLGEML
jgi:hypothetical protein